MAVKVFIIMTKNLFSWGLQLSATIEMKSKF